MSKATTSRSTVFKTNRSQAVRLPKAVAFPDDVHEVEITVVGNTRVVAPVRTSWTEFFLHGPRVSEDFMNERTQPDAEDREPF